MADPSPSPTWEARIEYCIEVLREARDDYEAIFESTYDDDSTRPHWAERVEQMNAGIVALHGAIRTNHAALA